jgi:hypothetical protein
VTTRPDSGRRHGGVANKVAARAIARSKPEVEEDGTRIAG